VAEVVVRVVLAVRLGQLVAALVTEQHLQLAVHLFTMQAVVLEQAMAATALLVLKAVLRLHLLDRQILVLVVVGHSQLQEQARVVLA
jgi:hypothetical protein